MKLTATTEEQLKSGVKYSGMTSRRTVKNEELVGVCFGVSGGEYCFGQYISILGSCGVLEI